MSMLLTVEGLTKRFGERLLFDIERMDIEVGAAYVLTGANGAGKSTLLRILCGLERAEVRRLGFLGQAMTLAPYPRSLRDAIAYVHQHPVMFSSSIVDNISYGLKTRGLPRDEIRSRVEEAVSWAGIGHLRNSPPQTLSGGEKQRVALARARVLRPRLMLLDEPTANLDGQAREAVIALIPTLLHSGGSVVMACHDRDLIGLPGVRRMKLRDGRLTLR
jgi:tungstate transport system ATP-binding protein